MKFVWQENSVCLQIFKAISQTNSIINVVFSNKGLMVMGMDSSKTSLVHLLLPPEYFEEYECEKLLEIGLYTASLVSILSKAKKNKLMWKASSAMALSICFVNGLTETEFSLRSIAVEEDRLQVPEITDDVAIIVNPAILTEILDKMIMAKSDLKFKIDNECLQLWSTSSDFATICHKEPICNGGLTPDRIEVTVRQAVSLSFGYNAIVLILNFCKVSKNKCFLGLSNEMPLRLKLNLGNGAYLACYIAPRVEDESY